jgi:predicted ATPase/DNA-binding CsgD family transcriptional regulator
VGREQEVQALCALLREDPVRLVTVTGPGGIGKTRLSLEVATRLRSTFEDGVCLVPLSTINKPLLVLPTITHQLGFGLRSTGHRWENASIETLKAFLHEKAFLLVLDNFEQVVSAAPDLTELLRSCPLLKILVTSRAALHLQGEHLFPLAPLAFPPHLPLRDDEDPTQYPTIQLFLQRARAVMPNLVLTDATMQAIAAICVQLDGLPLALELAAARVKVLPPQAMLPLLTHPLAILNGGLRDAPPRQQTLRKTLEWSYELLNDREQAVFRRLSLFTSGCTLETIETIDCLVEGERSEEATALEAVASLIDMSLLLQVDGEGKEPWFVMLATIREYALEMLEASGEQDAVRQAYATYYLHLVEQAESACGSPQQVRWIQRIEREYGNIRAALHWCLQGATPSMEESRRAEMALRLGGALSNFWVIHARVQEGREFLAQALAMQPQELSSKRARALLTAATLATTQSDFDQAEKYCLDALAIYQELEDQPGISLALPQLAWACWGNNKLEEALARATESLLLAQAQRNKERQAWSLHTLAFLESSRGQYAEAAAHLEESILLYDSSGQPWGIAWSRLRFAETQLALQKPATIIQKQVERCLALFTEVGDKEGIAYTQLVLGRVALLRDDSATAVPLLQKSVKFYREMGRKGEGIFAALTALARGLALQREETEVCRLSEEICLLADKITRKELLALVLESFAYVRVVCGELDWAVQLWAQASALRAGKQGPLAPVDKVEYDHFVALARNQLEEAAFQKGWELGSMAPAKQLLMREVSSDSFKPTKNQRAHTRIGHPMGLSEREVQVLQLIAKGLTNAEVADTLGLSKKTVAARLTNIFNKTATDNRAAAVAFALRHGLA